MDFKKAVKYGSKLKMGLCGPAGNGKTYTALAIASYLADKMGGRVAVLDTEHGSARKYADEFDFDVIELDSFAVKNYIGTIHSAEEGGYSVIIIDSLSHAWSGKDGLLEFVDEKTRQSRSKNAFSEGWKAATPLQNQLIDTMLGCKIHLIATMRTKTEWVVERDERTGKSSPRKVGMQPVQRDGMDYEFDVVGDMDDARLIISKSRIKKIHGKSFDKPGDDFAKILFDWCQGEQAPEATPEPEAPISLRDQLRERWRVLRDELGLDNAYLNDKVKERCGDKVVSSSCSEEDLKAVLDEIEAEGETVPAG